MHKILLVFGTRPEAIKMAPIIKELEKEPSLDFRICVTAQHREMLDQVLDIFNIHPDYDLDIMKENQDLFDITATILIKLKDILEKYNPNLILVHGDTTTTLASSIAAFYKKIKIGHIEAGLRTHNISSPWPEEANRQITDILSDFLFTPTLDTKNNLLSEGKTPKNVVLTGNTVIDALYLVLEKIKKDQDLENSILQKIYKEFPMEPHREFVLVTCHRRENIGESLINICNALETIAKKNPLIDLVFPVHLNPNIKSVVEAKLSEIDNIYLLKPLQYEVFVYLMKKSYFIITDSGGIQEEAPALNKPVLVVRNSTERIEGVQAGTIKLIGTDYNQIISNVQTIIDNKEVYHKMSQSVNPYGEGNASKVIIDRIKKDLL